MLKNISYISFFLLLLSSCTKEDLSNKMIVEGRITHLKKGTLYLQKVIDGNLKDIDSLECKGNDNYRFNIPIESAQIFYLTLDKNKDKTLSFFGEQGIIKINTSLEKFESKAKISGSKNQEILNKHQQIKTKFKEQNLELIKKRLEAQRDGLTDLEKEINQQSKNLLKRNYLYTTNFAINNAHSEVAPYLALTELYDANITLLDTINKSLSKDVKTSVYGKKLNRYIETIKATE